MLPQPYTANPPVMLAIGALLAESSTAVVSTGQQRNPPTTTSGSSEAKTPKPKAYDGPRLQAQDYSDMAVSITSTADYVATNLPEPPAPRQPESVHSLPQQNIYDGPGANMSRSSHIPGPLGPCHRSSHPCREVQGLVNEAFNSGVRAVRARTDTAIKREANLEGQAEVMRAMQAWLTAEHEKWARAKALESRILMEAVRQEWWEEGS